MAEYAANDKNRFGWPDALRAAAVFFIALGHLGSDAGALYPFVYTFHVQLFFFLSGLFAARHLDSRPADFFKMLVNRLLLPFLFLCLLNAVFFTVFLRLPIGELPRLFIQYLAGRRNNMEHVSNLWFFPCLIVMTVIYRLLAAAVRNKRLCFVLCFAASFAARCFLEEPFLLWSANCSVMYLVYYAAGDLFMPVDAGLSPLSCKKAAPAALFYALCAAVTVLTLFGFDARAAALLGGFGARLLYFLLPFPILFSLIPPARLAAKSRALRAAGRSTLLISGTEQISSSLLSVCGLSALTKSPAGAAAFAALTVVFAYFALAVPLKQLFPFVFSRRSDASTLLGK